MFAKFFSSVNIFSNSADYNIILINFLIIAIIASLLLVVNYFFRQKSNNWELNTQKYSAYECGFEPFSETQSNVFEIQFFLVSIMFLIFDIELALMFPWAIYFNFLNKFAFWIMILFVILLTIGFFYEWKKGALNWNDSKNDQHKQFIFFWLSGSYEPEFFINNLNFSWVSEYFFAILIVVSFSIIVILTVIKPASLVSQKTQQFVIGIWLLILAYYFLAIYFSNTNIFNFYVSNYFIIDNYTQLCKIFIILCLLVVFYFCISDYMYYHKYIIWELPIILLLASWFMVLLISSFNLFSLFISLEGLSLCLYILAAYDFDRRSSTEAAVKYFTLGTLSSGFLLLGIVFIYITIGSLDYLTIYQVTNATIPQPLLRIGSGLIFFSFLFKLGIWPCHQWVADVYTGVPTIITAIFSTSVKATIFFTLLRLYNYIIIEKPLVAIVSIMSLLVGIFGALQTNKFKRFLAYAAINQMGFILLGVFTYSIDVVLVYFIFYILTTLMIFLILLKTVSLGTVKLQEMIFISDLKTLSFYNPNIRLYLLVILFSMAGLPPFITAFTKWYILLVLLNQYFVVLCGISIILTIFSIYYYVRLVKHVFFEDLNITVSNARPVFYFRSEKACTLFLNLSAFILYAGPLGIYIYFNDFIYIFTCLGEICSLNILANLF
jgi:NADH-quinone oxidoreductase subunit N